MFYFDLMVMASEERGRLLNVMYFTDKICEEHLEMYLCIKVLFMILLSHRPLTASVTLSANAFIMRRVDSPVYTIDNDGN